jgi:hypothetical protein
MLLYLYKQRLVVSAHYYPIASSAIPISNNPGLSTPGTALYSAYNRLQRMVINAERLPKYLDALELHLMQAYSFDCSISYQSEHFNRID